MKLVFSGCIDFYLFLRTSWSLLNKIRVMPLVRLKLLHRFVCAWHSGIWIFLLLLPLLHRHLILLGMSWFINSSGPRPSIVSAKYRYRCVLALKRILATLWARSSLTWLLRVNNLCLVQVTIGDIWWSASSRHRTLVNHFDAHCFMASGAFLADNIDLYLMTTII